MNKINWTAVAVFGIIVLLFFLVGLSMMGGWGYGGWGMMGRGMMGPSMMGGWGFGPFGWIAMIFMWLVPLGLVVLTVLGVAWLIRSTVSAGGPLISARTCPNCGRTTQIDWQNCPYCGKEL